MKKNIQNLKKKKVVRLIYRWHMLKMLIRYNSKREKNIPIQIRKCIAALVHYFKSHIR